MSEAAEMTMIKKVARAMYENNHDHSWDSPLAEAFTKRIYLSDARAAIEALMEPTDAMLEAGERPSVGPYECKGIFQSMLRAALEGK